ncbi:anti-sigma-F factor Fin family protein [Paenibacillus pini]|nr:anti-sigma-F factor Fin family protein [Paenibacillus pini]
MAIKYICPHCHTVLGTIESDHVTDAQLGFHSLTPAERRDIIAYDLSGEVTVKVTCDYCAEALENNPELSLLVSPLQ